MRRWQTLKTVFDHTWCATKSCLTYIILWTPFLVQTQLALCCITWEQTMVIWFCWNIQDWYKVIIVIYSHHLVFFLDFCSLDVLFCVTKNTVNIKIIGFCCLLYCNISKQQIVLIDLSTHFNISSYCSAHVWCLTGQVGTV